MKKSADQDMLSEVSSPSLGLNSLNYNGSNIFGGRKSSFEMVNFLPSELRNSYESDKLHLN